MSEITFGERWEQRERLEEETARLLGRIVLGFGRLEFALGLCIRSIDSGGASESAFAARLKALARAVEAKCPPQSEPARAYGAWIERANAVKQLRNDVIHGRWDALPHSMEVGNIIAPPDCSEQRKVRYALADLESMAGTIAELHAQLGKMLVRWPL